jgi:hypothetical protein
MSEPAVDLDLHLDGVVVVVAPGFAGTGRLTNG